MKFEKIINGNSAIFKPFGNIDTTTAPEFEKIINGMDDNITDLVIDMSEVEYVSSAGLRLLLMTQNIMDEKGSLIVKNICQDIMDIISVTGFDEILTIE